MGSPFLRFPLYSFLCCLSCSVVVTAGSRLDWLTYQGGKARVIECTRTCKEPQTSLFVEQVDGGTTVIRHNEGNKVLVRGGLHIIVCEICASLLGLLYRCCCHSVITSTASGGCCFLLHSNGWSNSKAMICEENISLNKCCWLSQNMYELLWYVTVNPLTIPEVWAMGGSGNGFVNGCVCDWPVTLHD